MTDDAFAALVGRLEQEASTHPSRYRFKVLLLGTLGHAYLGGILLLCITLLLVQLLIVKVFTVMIVQLMFAVGLFFWTVIKALHIKLEAPAGIRLEPKQAPALFELVDDLRRQLKAPRFHRILINNEFNASVTQLPRLGALGWHRNYLTLGLPLMKGLTEAQFKAVLAHEFGHLARGHGRSATWIYCQRRRWSSILNAIDRREGRGRFMIEPFLRWFAPYFNAYSFPLARRSEYEADNTSAHLTSSTIAAQALTMVDIMARYLQEIYWPRVYSQVDDRPRPDVQPYLGLGQNLTTDLASVPIQEWLDQAMTSSTTLADTHPALCDRLRALGETPHVNVASPNDTADKLLGTQLQPITQALDQQWHDAVLKDWEERHATVQAQRARLTELEAKLAEGEPLSVEDRLDRVMLTECVTKDMDAALVQWRALHEDAPDNKQACFSLGARLLARDDASGCKLIEWTMSVDEEAILPGCELLRDFHLRQGDEAQAQAWHESLWERENTLCQNDHERQRIMLVDTFMPHDLPDELVDQVRTALKKVPGLRTAYLLRKQVADLPHRPCFVIAYTSTRWFERYNARRSQQILDQLVQMPELPPLALIINADGSHSSFRQKFGRLPGAKII